MKIADEPLFQRILPQVPFSERELHILILTAPHRYKEHFIEKRNGRGKRLISQPTAELKFLQRVIINSELANLPLHDAAIAYRQGRSIKDHAQPHATARYLLKLDFKDFFPSLKEDAVRYRLSRDTSYSENELWILCRLLCKKPRNEDTLSLSIGAPSSPYISNYLMLEFDTRLSDFCAAMNSTYTRYADDLAISTSAPHLLDTIKTEVESLTRELSYLGLTLNEQKTVNVSTKNRRTLAGLTLANSGIVSIGRDAKRRLRAMMHKFTQGELTPPEIARLRGHLAFLFSVDPEFVKALCIRHRVARIQDIT